MILFRRLRVTPILVNHEIGCIEKLISLAFHAYEDVQIGGHTHPMHQFESMVILDFELATNMGNK
jgi:hypothetical protein